MKTFDKPVFLISIKTWQCQTYFERLMGTRWRSEIFSPICTHINLRRDSHNYNYFLFSLISVPSLNLSLIKNAVGRVSVFGSPFLSLVVINSNTFYLFIYLFIYYTIFKGYFPFTVTTKYWLCSPFCTVHPWAHPIPNNLYLSPLTPILPHTHTGNH